MESFLLLVFGVAQSAIEACLNVWRRTVSWAQGPLSDWIRDSLMPALKHLSTEALVLIDKVSVPVRRLAKKAWKQLRKLLVSSLVSFERRFLNGKWVWFQAWVSEMYAKNEKSNTPVIKKQVIEQEVPWEDLPDEVRELFLRSEEETIEMDFAEGRDKEIDEMDMAA